ncbi:MAG: AIPR family protein [Mycoplasmoidaceae bacterium]|nr:AIPR family protein [Mycoplasmoidaceae bacterium]
MNNLFVALKDNLEADDKILRINLSFINISDENIDLDNYKSIIEARGGDLSDNDMELRNNVTAHFYNNETLLSLYDQCLNCQYPYVNAVETIKLTSDGVCKYRVPDEDLTGYLCNISAKSLAKLYQRYRNGLFSGNIRFFIKKGKGAKNVNIGIKESIRDKKKRGMFYFLNNGITFITPSVKFSKGSIEMDKFSIVNGGQTTYLIGTEPFDEDFSIPCKILEIKCDVSRKLQLKNEEKYKTNLTTWLSHARDISYALNSQKPVADKDLVTNRVSVKRLKEYYNRESNGNVIFLTKAGEDSFLPSEQKSKAIKLETYLTLVYCLFLQLPGFAKNQKQKMYAKTNIEKVLGLDEDRDSKKFLSPAQLIQANQMKKQIDKIINKIGRDLKKNPDQFKLDDTIKIGVLKYSKNIVLSLCGLAHMWSLNNDLFNSYSHHQYFQDEFRKKHSDYIDLTKPIFKKESISSSQAVEEAI